MSENTTSVGEHHLERELDVLMIGDEFLTMNEDINMGQAKQRGTFEERQKQGIEKEKARLKAHQDYINNLPKPSVKTAAMMAMLLGLGVNI